MILVIISECWPTFVGEYFRHFLPKNLFLAVLKQPKRNHWNIRFWAFLCKMVLYCNEAILGWFCGFIHPSMAPSFKIVSTKNCSTILMLERCKSIWQFYLFAWRPTGHVWHETFDSIIHLIHSRVCVIEYLLTIRIFRFVRRWFKNCAILWPTIETCI